MPPVAADGQVGTHLERPIDRLCAHTGNAAALRDEIDRFGAHVQVEGGKLFSVLGEEVEEIPLRHQRNELAARRQPGEIRKGVFAIPEEGTDGRRPLMGQPEELIEQAELAHELERRGVNGVAAKIAQEVAMFLQHHHIDAGTREQKAEHETARPAANNATSGGQLLYFCPLDLLAPRCGATPPFA